MSEAMSQPTGATTVRRFTQAHVDAWRDEGFAIIPGFFTPDEIAPVYAEYERLYGSRKRQADAVAGEDAMGRFNEKQFTNIDSLPYDGSEALNLMSLHPALIDFARALLGADRVHLYQSHTWAKFTGEANYDQPFHCDFGNHTLTVPSADESERSVDFILYFTDVTDAHGALHYVTKPDAEAALGKGAGPLYATTAEEQAKLKAHERSAAGPAGTLVAHGIDTFHRGTNLTAPGGFRYTMTCGYKRAGNEMIGFHVWQAQAPRDWTPVFRGASAKQLACLGVPAPGDPFWTRRTLKLTQARWPDWDMTEWFEKALTGGDAPS